MNPLLIILDKDLWRLGMFWGMLTCLILFIIQQSKRIGWIASILWAYVLVSALMIFEYPFVRFGTFNTAFMMTSAQTFSECLLIPMAVLSIPEKWMKFAWKVLTALICLEVASIWYLGYGIMIATSFDTALIAMFLPFAPFWLMIASVITILFHHGSTAMMILIVQCVVVAFSNKKLRPWAIGCIPLAIAAMFFHSHSSHLDGDERIHVWKSLLTHWWEGTNFNQTNNGQTFTAMRFGGDWISRTFGAGPGSFMWFSIMTEPTRMFLSAHSEPVQIAIELGFVGIALVLATITQAIKNMWHRPAMVSAILGVCMCSCFYHPLRFASTAILVAFIFREALTKTASDFSPAVKSRHKN